MKWYIFILILILIPGVFAQLDNFQVNIEQKSKFSLSLLAIIADKPVALPGEKVSLIIGIPLDVPEGVTIGNADIIVYRGSSVFASRNIFAELKQATGNNLMGQFGVNLQIKSSFNAPSSKGDYLVAYRVIDTKGRSIITETQQFIVAVLDNNKKIVCPKDSCTDWVKVGEATLGDGKFEARTCSSFQLDSCKQDARQEYRTICTSPIIKTIDGTFAECDNIKEPQKEEPQKELEINFSNIDFLIIGGLAIGLALTGTIFGLPGGIVGLVIGAGIGLVLVLL